MTNTQMLTKASNVHDQIRTKCEEYPEKAHWRSYAAQNVEDSVLSLVVWGKSIINLRKHDFN